MNECMSLQDICIEAILSNKTYRNVQGSLMLYSRMLKHLNDPQLAKLKKYCMTNLTNYFPMLITKFGSEELSKVLDAEDFKHLQKGYDDSQYIKARFNYLKGTVIEPPAPVVSAESLATGFYPYSALVQGVQWPAAVDPARREDFLSPEDFESIFNMSRAQYKTLDRNMRERLKKEKLLF